MDGPLRQDTEDDDVHEMISLILVLTTVAGWLMPKSGASADFVYREGPQTASVKVQALQGKIRVEVKMGGQVGALVYRPDLRKRFEYNPRSKKWDAMDAEALASMEAATHRRAKVGTEKIGDEPAVRYRIDIPDRPTDAWVSSKRSAPLRVSAKNATLELRSFSPRPPPAAVFEEPLRAK